MKYAKEDTFFINRCIELAEQSIGCNEAPFGSIVVKNGKIIAESGNATILHKDVTNHAEILAMKKAQKCLGSNDLSDCEIYSNCEPCPMCAFMMRELKFKKIVFSLLSPYMGGYSKWNILKDTELEKFTPVFHTPPHVVIGILKDKALKTFERIGWGEFLQKPSHKL